MFLNFVSRNYMFSQTSSYIQFFAHSCIQQTLFKGLPYVLTAGALKTSDEIMEETDL